MSAELESSNVHAGEALDQDGRLIACPAHRVHRLRGRELEKLLAETDEIEGEFPITAKLGERYDYVLIFTMNETEFVSPNRSWG